MIHTVSILSVAALLPACVSNPRNPCVSATTQTRAKSQQALAGALLDTAFESYANLRHDATDEASRLRYNRAVSELVVLLWTSRNDTPANRPRVLTGAARSYELTFAKGSKAGIWNPAIFTRMVPSSTISPQYPAARHPVTGVGATMVGIQAPDPLPPFHPPDGIAAPVTAMLDFEGSKATLTLLDPFKIQPTKQNAPAVAIATDSMAALDWYRKEPAWWNGLMGAIRGSNYMKNAGLYMLQPYDSGRIPLVFVHGLISTPQMWREVINGIEQDPQLRGKYQYWVFRYPTGNPVSYSALKLRDELKKIDETYPESPKYVLVGHSMGGIVSRMQAITVTRNSWDIIGRQKAQTFFSIIESGSVGDRATTYKANPKVSRLVFICTPHRGSKMAIGSLGELCKRLIALPADVSGPLLGSAASAIAIVSGSPGKLPNSITGLSPKSPTLQVVDSIPLTIPHHSIIGDRGKGDTPNSSDGVVDYWSSHLPAADSERIVPGPHGSHALPETIEELRRILHLHLEIHDRQATRRLTKTPCAAESRPEAVE